jgi:hypothetical protein
VWIELQSRTKLHGSLEALHVANAPVSCALHARIGNDLPATCVA